ncbi:unnamed protein product [Leptidea sinapis]|uniref:Uncharacterized protein n=1 Tax=Leptidea sinapis TaxID=189913 RepID=A0A5E4PZX0_9NEOP|nr:unnamed protein product [Leptidea sinapis]
MIALFYCIQCKKREGFGGKKRSGRAARRGGAAYRSATASDDVGTVVRAPYSHQQRDACACASNKRISDKASKL